MVVYKCDLCGQVKECRQKEIDHKEYDICRECWSELQAKLKGKGRVRDTREIVLLPPPREPLYIASCFRTLAQTGSQLPRIP
jgi:Zinc finger, ZZ type